jgi:predicted dehydrogenase
MILTLMLSMLLLPPDSHEEYAIAVMKAGKPVYVEKPMAVDAGAAKRIALFAKENNIKLSVAHYRREQRCSGK